MAEFRFAHDHAGEEGAERKRDMEECRGAVGDADRDGDHGQREQFARTGARHLPEEPGQHTAADDEHQGDEGGNLEQGLAYGLPERCAVAGAGIAAEHAGERRQQDEDEDGGEVFDDQPADRDTAVHRIEDAARFERLEQDDGAGAGQRQAEDQPGAKAPAPAPGDAHAEQRRQTHLDDSAGQRDALDGEQVVEREMQADAEHQQHHADFGELRGGVDIGNEARCRRADDDAGDEVADQGRQLDAFGNEAEDQRDAETGGQSGNQGDIVFHAGAGSMREAGWKASTASDGQPLC